jgi:HSP20 family protein
LVTRRSFARDTFKINVQQNDTEYLVEAELPGVKKEEIDLDLNDGRLTISVKREEQINEERRIISIGKADMLP